MSQIPQGVSDPGFLEDVRSAFRVAVERPLLPLTSILLLSLPLYLPPTLQLIAGPLWVFAIGYPGTQRIWLLRALRGQPFTFDQAFARNWSYFGRFIRLELLLIPPVAIGAGLGWLVDRSIVGLFVGAFGVSILLDFALTFVTPALAFTTGSASQALSLGLRMIRTEWPKAALYVLVPPLAILIVANLVPGIASIRRLGDTFDALKAGRRPPSVPQSVRFVSGGLSTLAVLVGLLFKGATVAFYTRRIEVPPFGASSGPGDAPPVPPRPDVTTS
jgi:hypothetical protein